MSIFETPAPRKPAKADVQHGPVVQPAMPPPINPDPPGDVRHVPNADERMR